MSDDDGKDDAGRDDAGQGDAGEGEAEDDAADSRQAEELSTAGPHVVYGAVLREGREELCRPATALAFSGLAAGLSMGFSLVAEALLMSRLPADAAWRPLIADLGYSAGFLIVVLGRQQLFTENTLTGVLPLLSDRSAETAWRLARLWAIVLAMNLAGVAIFAHVAALTPAFDEAARAEMYAIGRHTIELGGGEGGFWTVVLRGVFAGWLIALVVWLLPVARTAAVWVIVLLTYLARLGDQCHVIADTTGVLYVVAAGGAGWGEAVGRYVAPALIGNVAGGVLLVAVLNYAQVAAGDGRQAERMDGG